MKYLFKKRYSNVAFCLLVFLLLSVTLSFQSVASASEITDAEGAGEGAQLASTVRVTMHRLYNPYTGEHFYTASSDEKAKLVRKGWRSEGTGWIAPQKSSTPVYRLYNSYVQGGDHHYTLNKQEYIELGKKGWTQEGVGWYSVDEGDYDRIEVYRQYNPYATTGTHNFTTSKTENNSLVKVGWRAEGTAWYGYSTLTPSGGTIDWDDATVDTSDKTYCAKQIKPSVKILGLTAGVNYTVTYGANYNAGTGTITITGKGTWKGTKTYTFKINKLNISDASVTLGPALTYNGEYQTQTVKSVVKSGITLSTSNYTLTDNTQKFADEDKYVLKITGNGNFTGTAFKEFKIAKKQITAKWGETSFVNDGQVHIPTATLQGLCVDDAVNVTITVKNSAGAIVKQPKDVGSYVATATIDNDNYYFAKTQEVAYQITAS